jgi:site-specific DNA-adenine methylase
MTSYQGGKKRIGKRIYRVISEIEKILSPDKKLPYFEPFVGMGGVLRHFAREPDRKTTACDANIDLILMWKALQKGWKPPTNTTREEYERLKYSKEHSPERAFIGIVASFGNNFFGAYRLDYSDRKYKRKFMKEGYNGLMNILPEIQSTRFLNARSYDRFQPVGKLIYCDPPYVGNKLSSNYFQEFEHEKFWETMREWSKYNIVIISESIAPVDFKKIWCTESFLTTGGIKKFNTKHYKDCLFIHKNWENIFSKADKKNLSLI